MARTKNRIREGNRFCTFLIYFMAALVCLITLYPMYYVLILSISAPAQAATLHVYLYPKGFYLGSYKMLCTNMQMWKAYVNTIFYTTSVTLLMLLTCMLCAYPLTTHLIGRKFVVFYLLVPMYFGGGLIPTYLLMTKLHLYNNVFAVIIPCCFSIWNIILTKSYLSSIPETLREAAKIDGANHFRILFEIYFPLSKPILAVLAIYTIVGTWNSWFQAMIYLPNTDIQPLQLYLRRVLIDSTVDLKKLATMSEVESAVAAKLSADQLKYSMIIFTILPVLFTYPFFQKYFIKGVMLGSLKE